MRKLIVRIVAAILLAALASTAAFAEEWPTRPVRLVVPYAPGGNVDVATRIVAARLQEFLGQPFVVENKPGAGGMIAADFVAKAAPDGTTFFIGANGPLLFMPVITGHTGFDWQDEFVAVGALSFTPLVLQVRPDLGVKTVSEFFDLTRKRDLNMGSGGAGSTNHLVSELLQSLTRTKWTTIHYKGNAPVVAALLGGQVEFSFEQISVALPFIKDGRMRALAVTSRSRFPMLPDVPTFEESGFKGFEAVTWTGIFAPMKTSSATVARFSSALAKVLQEPAVAKRFTDLGSEARAMDPEAFKDYVRKENAKWLPVIKAANIKMD